MENVENILDVLGISTIYRRVKLRYDNAKCENDHILIKDMINIGNLKLEKTIS